MLSRFIKGELSEDKAGVLVWWWRGRGAAILVEVLDKLSTVHVAIGGCVCRKKRSIYLLW